ncbi:TetR/AcrR family transcriptional regulator [Micromonospora sp. STR1_7]|uniref:TetR/AcrR family transcriptional regulator n=1 Tax=Micromonospora parastrephiae TaxID=2806101 RepID=A0ABS1XXX2_9ACTN|nr:helix-turn-helix domain-containing protein [Micromonospora parastrephiae]MBM0234130.1 TetR/AcrR family transcriptional regulator [Micromonospora parastrephiae]
MTDASGRSGERDAGRQPIWARPERGTRGPAPAHSRDAIVVAAIALADTEGLAAVSMRAVASALGTGAGSLYRYLSSRDDLLDLMTDRVVGEMRPYPRAEGDWLDAMLLVARRQLALHRAHPWLLDVIHRTSGIGPESLAWFDTCIGILEPVPCAVTAKFEAIAMMTGVVSLFARSEATSGSFSFAGLDLAAYPHLVAAFSRPAAPAPRTDLFERTLRSLLTGLLAAPPEAG